MHSGAIELLNWKREALEALTFPPASVGSWALSLWNLLSRIQTEVRVGLTRGSRGVRETVATPHTGGGCGQRQTKNPGSGQGVSQQTIESTAEDGRDLGDLRGILRKG